MKARKMSKTRMKMNKGSKMRKHQSFTETVPNDVIANIAARVGSSSLSDLCNLKQSCKVLYELGEDNLVFKQVCMEKLPAIPWTLSPEAVWFLERCQETGNPEALYRLGMVEYFSNVRLELGQACLARAAYLGHVEASYALGIILICTDTDIKSRAQGMELLNMVERCRHLKFSECRKQTKAILGDMWLNHYISLQQPICTNSNCSKIHGMPSTGWTRGNNDEEINCQACRCEREVKLFCSVLRSSD